LGRRGEERVFDGGAVASHVNGIQDGEGAADSEDKAEEDTDECTGEEVHDDAMVCSVLPKGSLIGACDGRINNCGCSGRGFLA